MTTPDNRSVPELFSDALSQLSKLLRDEIHLARAELSLKATEAITGIGLLAGAAIISIPTIVLLLMGLAALLVENGTRPSMANFLAGGLGLIGVGILAWAGKSRLQARNLVPERTLDELRRDVAAVKEQV